MLKLQMLCGIAPPLSHEWEVVEEANLKTKLDYKDNSVDLIYCSHGIGYIPYELFINEILPEWYRILKPGGILRLSVINYTKVLTQFQDFTTDILKIWQAVYNAEAKTAEAIQKVPQPVIYDEGNLKFILNKAKFSKVKKWSASKLQYKDRSSKKLNGRLISLNLEGVK